MIEIPQEAWDRADEEQQFDLYPPGNYYVQITGTKKVEGVSVSDKDYLEVAYRVLAGEKTQECNGKSSTERFYLTGEAIGRLANLCKRVGLQRRGTPSGGAGGIEPQALVGAQVVVEITHSQRESKKGTAYTAHQWKWGAVWPLDHPKAPREFVGRILRATQTQQQPAARPAPVAIEV